MNGLIADLARPVALGYLTPGQAVAALANVILEDERSGLSDGTATFEERLRIGFELLERQVGHRENDRDLVRHRIAVAAQKLIAADAHRGRIRAEAHDINADAHRMLREDEVEETLRDVVKREVQRAPAYRRARRYHGR